MDCSPQAPLFMGFSRQEYWSGMPCTPPGDPLDPRIKPESLTSAKGFFFFYYWRHLGSPVTPLLRYNLYITRFMLLKCKVQYFFVWFLLCLQSYAVVIVQSLSHIWFFEIPWTAACQASLSFTIPEFSQTHVHWVSDAIQPSHPLLPPSPPAFNLSHVRVFSNESVLRIRWPVLEFQLQHQSFQWIFRVDFL